MTHTVKVDVVRLKLTEAENLSISPISQSVTRCFSTTGSVHTASAACTRPASPPDNVDFVRSCLSPGIPSTWMVSSPSRSRIRANIGGALTGAAPAASGAALKFSLAKMSARCSMVSYNGYQKKKRYSVDVIANFITIFSI